MISWKKFAPRGTSSPLIARFVFDPPVTSNASRLGGQTATSCAILCFLKERPFKLRLLRGKERHRERAIKCLPQGRFGNANLHDGLGLRVTARVVMLAGIKQ